MAHDGTEMPSATRNGRRSLSSARDPLLLLDLFSNHPETSQLQPNVKSLLQYSISL